MSVAVCPTVHMSVAVYPTVHMSVAVCPTVHMSVAVCPTVHAESYDSVSLSRSARLRCLVCGAVTGHDGQWAREPDWSVLGRTAHSPASAGRLPNR